MDGTINDLTTPAVPDHYKVNYDGKYDEAKAVVMPVSLGKVSPFSSIRLGFPNPHVAYHPHILYLFFKILSG